jgi:hypothetical protein
MGKDELISKVPDDAILEVHWPDPKPGAEVTAEEGARRAFNGPDFCCLARSPIEQAECDHDSVDPSNHDQMCEYHSCLYEIRAATEAQKEKDANANPAAIECPRKRCMADVGMPCENSHGVFVPCHPERWQAAIRGQE